MAKDFRKKTFSKVIRGYAAEEVDEYLAYVTEEYRKLERRAADYERKLMLALKKLEASSDEAEDTVQRKADEAYMAAAAEAQAIISEAETVREAAIQESEKQLREAEIAAKAIVGAAREDAVRTKEQAAGMYDAASEMYDEVISFRDTLFVLYSSHIEAVESIAAQAETYVGKVDAVYSEASGETVSHEEPDEEEKITEEEIVEEAPGASENTDVPEENNAADSPARDLYIDIGDDIEEAEVEEADDDDFFTEDEESDAEKTDFADGGYDESAMTRVLRLSAISEAIAAEESDDFSEDGYEDYEGSEPDDDFAEEEEVYEDDEIELPEDFEDAKASFRDMDSLFTSESEKEMSLTDVFDRVFASSDSKKNIEEIRRQPIVTTSEPKNPKKHSKF